MATKNDYRDAIGWLYASARGDSESRNQLAMMCDPTGLVDALTDMLLGLARIGTNGDVFSYLDYVRDNLDDILGPHEMEEDS